MSSGIYKYVPVYKAQDKFLKSKLFFSLESYILEAERTPHSLYLRVRTVSKKFSFPGSCFLKVVCETSEG